MGSRGGGPTPCGLSLTAAALTPGATAVDTTVTDPTAQDPDGLDLEALLEARRRLTRTVQFRRADDLITRHRELTQQLERARLNPDADRAEGEPTAEQAEYLLEQLAAQWDARGTTVTVEERTRAELMTATKALRRERARAVNAARDMGPDAPAAGEDHAELMLLTQLAECLVTPDLSVAQLQRVYRSSITGQAAVEAMWSMVQEVCEVPVVPSWRRPSDTPAGPPSALS